MNTPSPTTETTPLPVLSDDRFESWMQSVQDWSCPACSRKGMSYPPERHDDPFDVRKRCRCGAKVWFFYAEGRWWFVLKKEFRHHGRRWCMTYESDEDKTEFIHRKLGPRDDFYSFDKLVSVARFKKLIIFS